MTGNLLLQDNIQLQIGTGADLKLYHNATDSFIENQTGILKIQSSVTDGDISFLADNGSGTATEYFKLDGSDTNVRFSKDIKLSDGVLAMFGGSNDLLIYHDGSNSYIDQVGTGDLYIRNTTDDETIFFQNDDGSGGVTTYFEIQGSNTRTVFRKTLNLQDSVDLYLGTSSDLRLVHNGSDSVISNATGNLTITNNADDSDIIFQSDDGSGGVTEYFKVDGGDERVLFSKQARFLDSVEARFGTSGDLRVYHDGSNSVIQNLTGNLTIQTTADDSDVIFKCDDGSGGNATYFKLDGSEKQTIFSEEAVFADSKRLMFGAGGDLQILHNATDSSITNTTGDLEIIQNADDKDIIFRCDNGSGGNAPYLTLDGSQGFTTAQKTIRFDDGAAAQFGGDADLRINHNGTDSFITNHTGDLKIIQNTDDKDIIFQCDDGSGGVTTYMFLDGSSTQVKYDVNLKIHDSKKLIIGDGDDLQIYHSSGTNIIDSAVGDLIIKVSQDDGDMIFQSDNGSGAISTYFRIDGGQLRTEFELATQHLDNIKANFGSSSDLAIYHNGSDSFIQSSGTGDLIIEQRNDDKDIVFNCDDGSGGVTEYIRLDGSTTTTVASKQFKFEDDVKLFFGTGADSALYASSDNLIIEQTTDDKDIIFKSDDGSGGTATYMFLDGSNTRVQFNKDARFVDSAKVMLGTSDDLQIQHNGTDSFIEENSGNLNIANYADDKDIRFFCDDGSGGITTYFQLDGGQSQTRVFKNFQFEDAVIATFGTSADMQIFHNGTDSFIDNYTGNLTIRNRTDDGDIVFTCDDGSGGLAEYFKLDGSLATHDGSSTTALSTVWGDNSKVVVGDGADGRYWHDGTNTYLQNTTGDLIIQNFADDKDIIFKSDDGSGSTTEYFRLDGSTEQNVVSKNMRFEDSIQCQFGAGTDLRIYHDGSDSYISDTGTGGLYIKGSNFVTIQSAGGENMIKAIADGSIELYEDNSKKFETTTSGVQVTGSTKITSDGSDDDGAEIFLKHANNNTTDTIGTIHFGNNADNSLSTIVSETATNNTTSNLVFKTSATGTVGTVLTLGSDQSATFAGNIDVTGRMTINDGNDNVLIGDFAGDALSSGSANVAIGELALTTEDGGSKSTAVGKNALRLQNNDGDNYNVGIGHSAGENVTTGTQNTLIGGLAGDALTTGQRSVAVGYLALSTETGSDRSVAIGTEALKNQNVGSSNAYNVAVGDSAGEEITSGVQNTIIGGLAGDALTTGIQNVAIGYGALSGEDSHGKNVAIGFNALNIQNAGADAYNVAVGYDAGLSVTTGVRNTIVGGLAGDALTVGEKNTAIGYSALSADDTGSNNTAVGHRALSELNFDGNGYNTALGSDAGRKVSTGTTNTLIGALAGDAVTTGTANVALGYGALSAEDGHGHNVAIGYHSLVAQNAGANAYNVAIGSAAGSSISTGVNNVFIGGLVADAITGGDANVAIGKNAMGSADGTESNNVAIGFGTLATMNSDASNYNVAVGYDAGTNVTTGDQNTIIGGLAGDSLTTGTNNVIIGYNAEASAVGAADEITLGNANNDTIRAAVQTISSLSDERDKTNIQESTYGLDFIDQLNPVTFDWNTRDGSRKGKKDLGFIAQELDAVDDEYTQLVYKSNPDKLEASYGRLVPVLVKAIQELKQEIEHLKNK